MSTKKPQVLNKTFSKPAYLRPTVPSAANNAKIRAFNNTLTITTLHLTFSPSPLLTLPKHTLSPLQRALPTLPKSPFRELKDAVLYIREHTSVIKKGFSDNLKASDATSHTYPYNNP